MAKELPESWVCLPSFTLPASPSVLGAVEDGPIAGVHTQLTKVNTASQCAHPTAHSREDRSFVPCCPPLRCQF